MKIKLNNVFLSLLLLVIVGCNTQDGKIDSAIFCGQINEANDNIVTLRYGNNVDTVDLDSNNVFHFNVDLDEGQFFIFGHGKEITTLFIEPGDSINLILNVVEFDETILYSGIGAEKNNYLAANYLENEKGKVEIKVLYSLSPDSFIFTVDSVKNYENNRLSEMNFSKIFIEAEKAKLLLENAVGKLNYPSYFEYFKNGEKPELPANWYDFTSLINLNDLNIKSIKEYEAYISRLISYEADKVMANDSLLNTRKHKSTASKLKTINKIIVDAKDKNDLLFKYMKEHVMYYSINDLDVLLNDFRTFCTDSAYISQINDEINKWGALAAGMPAPDFTYSDIKGNKYALSDFLGKYVYIDVWATWCSPCIKEIPYLIKLQDKFKDKNIVFMSISVDKTPEPWKKMVLEDEMQGLQLYADSAWESTLTTDYMIRSIPRFLLIDREGKIIDVRAPRPSGEIGEIINTLDGI